VAESACLESKCIRKGTASSNLAPTANKFARLCKKDIVLDNNLMKKIMSSASFLKNIFNDLEIKSFLLFYFLCKFRFKYFDESHIKKYQARKAKAIVRYAINNSKYFKKYYADYNLDNISLLPTVNKKMMMDNLTDYNTIGLTKEEILNFCLEVEKTRNFSKRLKGLNIGMSSGTSGNKGVEILTREEEKYMKAALFARFHFPKNEKINLAFILRVSAPAFSLGKFGHKLTYISQLNSIDEIKKQLEKIQPNIVSAPPSMLKILAKEIENNRLSIKPQKLISYAEILYPDVKKYLNKVFNCPVHEIYKSTEGPIAISCKYGRLHINEDLVLVETLNNDGTITSPGRPCQKLIVTDLHKKSQPIIRYELNDIITISPDKCQCGSSFRVIENIQGRADDLFWSKNIKTNKWQHIFPDYISRAIITASEDINEYQVIQNSPNDILVRIQLKEGVDQKQFNSQAVMKNIYDVFISYNCEQPKISIVFENPEFNKNSSKLIRIHRNFILK
jgi:putative adenylate-forming enzyme